MLSPYSYSTYHKYIIILGIIENLGSEFNQVKDYIELEINDMFDDYKTLLDIKQFQDKIVAELTTRNVIKIFRSIDVPKPNNQKSINNSGVTDEKKSDNKDITRDEFKTKRIPRS